MADKKITELASIDSIESTDIFPMVDDPSGTPETKKSTFQKISDWLATLIQSFAGIKTDTIEEKTSGAGITFNSLTKGIIPVGTIVPYAGSTAPNGWLLCDGSAVSRTTYSALFNVIGTTYGAGDGSTTFNLPNLKGRVPVGIDTSQSEFQNLGQTGGAKTHTLNINEIPSHNHSLIGTNNNNFTVQAGTGNGVSGIPNNVSSWGSYGQANWFTWSFTTASVGGGQPHNNLQPYITVNYLIKY